MDGPCLGTSEFLPFTPLFRFMNFSFNLSIWLLQLSQVSQCSAHHHGTAIHRDLRRSGQSLSACANHVKKRHWKRGSMNERTASQRKNTKKLLSDHLPFTIYWNTIVPGCREMTAYCNAANQSRSHFSTPPMTLETPHAPLWKHASGSVGLTGNLRQAHRFVSRKTWEPRWNLSCHTICCQLAAGWRNTESKLKSRPAERLQKPHEDPTWVIGAVECILVENRGMRPYKAMSKEAEWDYTSTVKLDTRYLAPKSPQIHIDYFAFLLPSTLILLRFVLRLFPYVSCFTLASSGCALKIQSLCSAFFQNTPGCVEAGQTALLHHILSHVGRQHYTSRENTRNAKVCYHVWHHPASNHRKGLKSIMLYDNIVWIMIHVGKEYVRNIC